jgi:hypothetical protein
MNTSTSARCTSLFLFSLILFATGLASAEGTVPDGINYQGLLTDAKGDPVKPDGTYTLEFRLWSDPDAEDTSTSALVWGRSFTVTVVSGQFNVILNDDGTALAEDAEHRVKSLMDAFAEPKRYLGIKIANAPVTPQEGKVVAAEKATTITGEIKPRQAILSAPYAIKAENGAPIGSIMAFDTFNGTLTIPDGWLPCDNKKIEDPDSPLIGKSTPNLISRFIRGNSTSGGTGGSLTGSTGYCEDTGTNLNEHKHEVPQFLSPHGGGQDGDKLPLGGIPFGLGSSITRILGSGVPFGGPYSTRYLLSNVPYETTTVKKDLNKHTHSLNLPNPPYYDVIYIVRVK